MVKRLDNWPMLYADFLKERQNMPFEWGKNDCMRFIADGVATITGTDFYADYAGYTDEETARDVVALAGGMVAIVTKHLGPDHSHPLKAKRGDVVLLKVPNWTAGLVDDTGGRIAFVSPQGLVRMPLTRAQRIWSY